MSEADEYFVVDRTTGIVHEGPFDNQDDAAAAVDGPEEIIATRGALELLELSSSTTIRWQNDDVATDGGHPPGNGGASVPPDMQELAEDILDHPPGKPNHCAICDTYFAEITELIDHACEEHKQGGER